MGFIYSVHVIRLMLVLFLFCCVMCAYTFNCFISESLHIAQNTQLRKASPYLHSAVCCFSSPPEALWSSGRRGEAYCHTSFHPYISSKKQGEAEHQSDGQYEEVTRRTAGTGSNGHARHAGTARLATASPVGRQRAVPLSSLRMSCADFLSQCACQVMTSSDVRTRLS